jgi:serine phosphatase RsbU (regulator of sigma subunit)/anti-sigma regulatory factor (Ser/Thr protein kinase)
VAINGHQNPTGMFRGWRETIPADIEKTRQCVIDAKTFLKAFSLEETTLDEVELVLMEAVTNTVKHAPSHSEQVAGVLEIQVSAEGIECRIEDYNAHYGSKITAEFPDVDHTDGRGFPIMEILMDRVDHVQLPKGNLLIMFKKIPVNSRTLLPEVLAIEKEMSSLVEELMSCYESLTAFFKFGALISETDNKEEFREQLLTRLLQITGSNRGILRLLDKDTNNLIQTWSSNHHDSAKEVLTEDATTPEGRCAQMAEDVWTCNGTALELHQIKADSEDQADSHIGLVHAVSFRSETIGTLWLQRDQATQYSSAQINMIHTFSDFIAIHHANNRYQKEMLRIGKVEREMQIARDIQHSLLPTSGVDSDRLSIAGVCQPAREVGGDYYDHLILSPHSVLLVIADIMGKGVPASLFVAIFRSMVRSQFHLAEQPAELAARVNQLCYDDLNRVGMFLTAQFCYINTEQRIMRVANAGHWPLLYVDRDNPKPLSISPDGLPIGVDADFPFEQTEVSLAEHFNLAMYTDGIPEAMSSSGEPFGAEGMEQWIMGSVNSDEKPETSIQSLIRLTTACNTNEQGRDDLSVLMVKSKTNR